VAKKEVENLTSIFHPTREDSVKLLQNNLLQVPDDLRKRTNSVSFATTFRGDSTRNDDTEATSTSGRNEKAEMHPLNSIKNV